MWRFEKLNSLPFSFDTVTRLVTKNIYGCCSPYKAVAVGAVNRPVYECQ